MFLQQQSEKTPDQACDGCRVSTDDKNQTVENQLRDLLAIAQRDLEIVFTFTDEGVSSAKERDKWPGFDAPPYQKPIVRPISLRLRVGASSRNHNLKEPPNAAVPSTPQPSQHP